MKQQVQGWVRRVNLQVFLDFTVPCVLALIDIDEEPQTFVC